MSAKHATTNFHNHANVQHQVGVQNIHGDYHYTSQTVNVSLPALNAIPYANDASFDSFGLSAHSCHPQTRVELLRHIQQWTTNVAGEDIFWLKGKPGTGKSTISHTIAEFLSSEKRLGASFFFKRGEGDRGTARLLFPTITRQLIETIPELGSIVYQAIQDNPRIFEKKLSEQFDKLLYRPLQTLASTPTGFPSSTIIILDALDECDNDDDIRVILKLWSFGMQSLNKCLKVFITSRPELPIRIGFKRMSPTMYHNVDLHDVPDTITRHDLFIFLRDNLLDFVSEYNAEPIDGPLEHQWPGEKNVQKLVEIAHPLFIIAATICRSIRDPSVNPMHQLNTIMERQKLGEFKQVGRIYLPVLERAIRAMSENSQSKNAHLEFQEIIGTITILAQPLSTSALANLLQRPKEAISLQLRPLHSVLHVPSDTELVIRPIHLSFPEFLLATESQKYPFGVDRVNAHKLLLAKSLQLLSSLRQNLCHLTYPGEKRESVDSIRMEQCIPLELQYSCRYWIYHLRHSETALQDGGEVHSFLQSHFLHWLEALSMMGLMSESVDLIADLQSLTMDQGAEQLREMLEDLRRFVHANRHVIRVTPLQVYSSSIVFAPKSSIVRSIAQEPGWLKSFVNIDETWNTTLEVMEGHSEHINAMVFADGQILASASDDKTVKLWNTATGLEIQRLEGHTRAVIAVAFSRKGDYLASASEDGVVHVWDLSIGQIQRTVSLTDIWPNLHDPEVIGLSFREDNKLLALVRIVDVSIFDVSVWDIFSETLEHIYSPKSYTWKAFFSGDSKLVICVHSKWRNFGDSDEEVFKRGGSDQASLFVTIDLPSHAVARATDYDSCVSRNFWPAIGSSEIILAVSGSGKQLHFHNIHTNACIDRFNVGNISGTDAMALSHDLRSIAYATSGYALKVVALRGNGEQRDHSIPEYARYTKAQVLNGDQAQVVVRTESIAIYSLVEGTLHRRSLFHDTPVHPVGSPMELSHDRNLLAIMHHSGFTVCDLHRDLWHTVSSSEGSDGIEDFLFSYDDQLIVTKQRSGLLELREISSLSAIMTTNLRRLSEYRALEAVDFEINPVWLNSDSIGTVMAIAHRTLLLAIVFGVNSLATWDIAADELTLISHGETEFFREGRRVSSMIFSPDDSLIISSDSEEISIWRMTAGAQTQQRPLTFPAPWLKVTLSQHEMLAMSHNNEILATANAERLAICKLQFVGRDWELQALHILSFGPCTVGPQIHNLQFSLADDMILTNLGSILISKDGTISFPGLFVQEKWIQKDGRDLLYIPHDYRSRYIFVTNATIMMVTDLGRVNVIEIAHNDTD